MKTLKEIREITEHRFALVGSNGEIIDAGKDLLDESSPKGICYDLYGSMATDLDEILYVV